MIVCEGISPGGALAQLCTDAETAAAWMRSIEQIATKSIVWEVWHTDQNSLRDATATKPKVTP